MAAAKVVVYMKGVMQDYTYAQPHSRGIKEMKKVDFVIQLEVEGHEFEPRST